MPSPAFSTGIPISLANRKGAPEAGWRRTMQSQPAAISVMPVSTRDSPFSMLDALALTRVVIAPKDFEANSNDTRVRVLAS